MFRFETFHDAENLNKTSENVLRLFIGVICIIYLKPDGAYLDITLDNCDFQN